MSEAVGGSEAIQEFLVKLGFNVDKESLSGFLQHIDGVAIGVAGFAAAMAAAAVGVVHSIEEIASEYKTLDLLATQLKSTAEEVDNFADTAQILGIGTKVATDSLKALSSNVSDAALGIGRAKIIFEKLGIEVLDVNGKARGTVEVMGDLKEKLSTMDRAAQLRIMERLGLDPKLLVMFNDSLGKTKQIAEDLEKIDTASGFDLSESIAQSKEFEKSWKGMQIQVNLFVMLFSKMHDAIAVKMMPGIQAGVDNITKAIERARHFIMDNALKIENALQPILETVVAIAAAFVQITANTFEAIGNILKPIVDTLIELNKKTNGWLFGILGVIAAWKLLNLSFLMSPIGLFLALSAAVLLLVDDFITFSHGGKALIDWGSTFGGILFWLGSAIAGVTAAFYLMKGAMVSIAIASNIAKVAMLAFNFVASINPFVLIIAGIVALISAAYMLITHWDVVKEWLSKFWEWLKEKGEIIGKWMSSGFNAAADKVLEKWNAIKLWFIDFFGWFSDKADVIKNIAGKIPEIAGDMGNGISDGLHSMGNKVLGFVGMNGAPASNNVNQSTVINVNGAQNPQATAQIVTDNQTQVNAQMTRNMSGSVR